MPLSPGVRLGPYEVTGTLGAGGMGEVYRARDTRLGRDVALKVLPPDVERDPDALSRLAREARLLASLDHPNIGAVHGWEESSGVHAIVLELIEGPTLRDRIAGGPLPIDEALKIARQIADALDAAHEQGIIHRDLKPANIKIRPDGRVKVLDFGLAKAMAPSSGDAAATTVAGTQPGVIIGTPAYMSPEQTRGEPVTRGADVWAFGVVIYEMLTGRHPFSSGSMTDTLAAILRGTPDWDALPRKTPEPVIRLLQRCLEKDPRTRLRDIGDARLEIEEARASLSGASSGTRRAAADLADARRSSTMRRVAIVGGVLLLAAAAVAAAYLVGRSRSAPASTEARLSILSPPDKYFGNAPAVSPDGRSIAFIAGNADGTHRMLWLRALSSSEAHALRGTDDAEYPFWSPDGEWIGFSARSEGKLKRVRATGTDVPVPICDVPVLRGATWLDDRTIVFGYNKPQGDPGPLYRVAESGGVPTPLTTLDTDHGEQSHRWPFWIRGGYLLYYVWSKGAPSGLRLVSLDSPSKPIAFYAGYSASQFANGYLISTRSDHWIRAQRMTPSTGALSGDEVAIALSRTADYLGRDAWSSSPTGVIANLAPFSEVGQFAWVSREGRVLATLGDPIESPRGVELSPDGTQFVTQRADKPGIWAIDSATGAQTLVSKTAGAHSLWSSDGTAFAFLHQEPPPTATQFSIMTVGASGAKPPVELLADPTHLMKPVAWTHDGIFAYMLTGGLGFDIWTMPVSDPSKATAYLQDGSSSPEGRVSPDGHWLAYSNDQLGALEVYVRRFPDAGPAKRISQNGGRFPRWRADGRELYYLAGATLMAVSVTGDPPSFAPPAVCFEMRLISNPIPLTYANYEYDVNKDGTKFIVDRVVGGGVPTLDVITNWKGGGS